MEEPAVEGPLTVEGDRAARDRLRKSCRPSAKELTRPAGLPSSSRLPSRRGAFRRASAITCAVRPLMAMPGRTRS